MPLVKGEKVQLGLAKESTRGTFASPTEWIRARTPNGIIPTKEEINIQEVVGSGMDSQSSVIGKRMAQGDLEFNVRNRTFGYLLLSLLGKVSTSANADASSSVYDHVFSLETSTPEHPTLSLAVAQGANHQHYGYPLGMVSSIEMNFSTDDVVNATTSFIAGDESAESDFSPSYPSDDHLFNHSHANIYFASSASGLDGASKTPFSQGTVSLINNARDKQNIGEVSPSNMFAQLAEFTASLTTDYEDETHRDAFFDNDFQAMRVELINTGVTIGTAANPSIVIDFPKVSINSRNVNRAIDDVVQEELEIKAHYDESEAKAITATITNEVTSY